MLEQMPLATLTDSWLLAAILVIVFLGAIVQFGLGMGFGLTVAPMLAIIDPELVPAPTLFLGLMTAFIGAVRERHDIVWQEVGTGIFGRILGIAVAVLILASLPDRSIFELLFGLLVGLAVLFSIAGWRLNFSPINIGAMGIVSGIMGTITSVGAPPMAIVYQDKAANRARPTLAAFFALGCALSLLGLFLSGWADETDFLIALIMVPGVGAGYLASRLLKGSFDSRYRRYLLAITMLASIILIVRGLEWI
jgi:uncharacterized membrane protein YfcA